MPDGLFFEAEISVRDLAHILTQILGILLVMVGTNELVGCHSGLGSLVQLFQVQVVLLIP